jgi:hypothetical protein
MGPGQQPTIHHRRNLKPHAAQAVTVDPDQRTDVPLKR